MPPGRSYLASAVALAVALCLVAVACDDDGTPAEGDPSPTQAAGEASPTQAAEASPTAGETPAGAMLDVSLDDFSVTVDPDAVAAGPATFNVTNDGGVAHQFIVIATDLAPDALPFTESGFTVDLEQLDVVATAQGAGGDETIVRDEEVTLEVDLAPGSYVLICNVGGHYESGMRAALSVE